MDLRTLKYIVAIAEHRNLTKAAESLYVGQPTLSKSLAAVEEKLGLKLFRKVGRVYVPTGAGERYIQRAREILTLSESLDAEMADILQQNEGELNVSFANMRASYMLPKVLPAFAKRYPNVKVNVFEGSSDENDRRLLEGTVEIAFYTASGERDPRLEYQPLAREELLICACENHPIRDYSRKDPEGGFPCLSLSPLRETLVLMMRPEQRTRQIVDSLLKAGGVRLERVLYTSNIHAIMGLVAAGYGVSFVFDTHLRHRADPAPIDCYRIGRQGAFYDFVAASRKGAYISGWGREFIETVRNCV